MGKHTGGDRLKILQSSSAHLSALSKLKNKAISRGGRGGRKEGEKEKEEGREGDREGRGRERNKGWVEVVESNGDK